MPVLFVNAIWLFLGIFGLHAAMVFLSGIRVSLLMANQRLDPDRIAHRYWIAWRKWGAKHFLQMFVAFGVVVVVAYIFNQESVSIGKEIDSYRPGTLIVSGTTVPSRQHNRMNRVGNPTVFGGLYDVDENMLLNKVRLIRRLVDPARKNM